ncbi:helix-turn-helix domain-containing protein [Maribacter sp. ACAM166]|uniref:helix-turn-helix domain-containing protein n=1 Tax=Maribacter sp. ACAM166 TaxID=2508996 RepID=UPI0010FE386E|nr:helix-turn-helix domain-containing protein [Maribacter sp. ACAM166]TLP80929.1 helix-turn-helix domain-containing protein [Maribacter sp. ACAM166]
MQVQIELPKEFLNDIDYIKRELETLKKSFQPKQPKTYLTRQEVAKLLSVDLSTVHNLSKRGTLQKLQIGGRVLYLRSQVEQSIVKLNN